MNVRLTQSLRSPLIALLIVAGAAVLALGSIAPAGASATTIAATAPAHAQEGEPDAQETERPPYLAPEDDGGTEETVYISLAVGILVVSTLMGLAFGLFGYLER